MKRDSRQGLGAPPEDASISLWGPKDKDAGGESATESRVKAGKAPLRGRVKTSLTLFHDTAVMLDVLKAEARIRTGQRVSKSDLLDEAVRDLARKWDVEWRSE